LDFDSAIRRFDSCRSSQPFMRSARFSKKRENGPEIPAFRAFDFVSGLPVPDFEVEIAESLWTCRRIFPFCGDYRGDGLDHDCSPMSHSLMQLWQMPVRKLRETNPFALPHAQLAVS